MRYPAPTMHPALSIARATTRDLLRRPGIHLATLATGALLATLHEMAAVTFGATPALAVELTLSTCAIFLSLVAAVTGVRAASAGDDLGPTAALSAAPVGWSAYTVGRFAGIQATVTVLLGGLLVFAAAGHVVSAGELPLIGMGTLIALAGVLAQAGLFAALGLALAALAPQALALVLTLALLVGSRTLLPAMADHGGLARAVALLLPDPLRVDFAREAAGAAPIAATGALLAGGAVCAYVVALLLSSTAALSGRERH